ncbi:MAG: CoA-binding protein [Gemmatimonadetes bacterium]|nr:CoA-binding protein [Gemmatimonadota bacterium]MBI3569135.1 CoA-binding protein [Gemmatimonadota bacterium]
MTEEWRRHLIETAEGIDALLERVHRVAVLGIKPDDHAAQPAWFVPDYAQRAGLRIVPVALRYPDVQTILGEPVVRSLGAIEGPVDLVDVFRRPADLPAHVDDLIALRPGAVWFQLGIRNDEAAERLARAGIDVVQDRCLKVELEKRGR